MSELARLIVKKALQKGSTDDCTCLAAFLYPVSPPAAAAAAAAAAGSGGPPSATLLGAGRMSGGPLDAFCTSFG
ncbi:hypothetical protein Emed_004692 [Eimeria media]